MDGRGRLLAAPWSLILGRSPLVATIVCLTAAVVLAGGVSYQGQQLAARYDAMDVEHHWLPGYRVDWLTGEPVTAKRGATQCSAFAAAACQRLGVYLLRPPDQGRMMLANAQAAWLPREGVEQGWRPVADPFQAQSLANQGVIVVAVIPGANPRLSGHIALVRPADKPEALVADEGPQVIQAGAENAASTSLRQGFRHHPGAWNSAKDYGVAFFAHDLP
jgi:hypothetical protein